MRNRIVYGIIAFFIMVIGLLSRQIPTPLMELFGKYPGDIFWAMMLFFALGTVSERLSTVRLALLTMAMATTVELSQLYHADWLDTIRRNFIGHLVLGASFSVYDIVAYGFGIIFGASIDHAILRNGRSKAIN